MALILTISNTTYSVIEGSESTDDTSDGRSVFTCTIKDLAGAFDFQPNEPVTFTDTTNNYTYTGYINDSTKTPLPPSAALLHTINCIDGHYIPDKRYYAGPEYVNRYAGDIAADLAINVLQAEGINIAYAVDSDQSLAQWQQGTQNHTTAVNTATGGALELALAGTAVTKTESTGTDWGTGTRTNLHISGNTLTLKQYSALQLTGNCVGYQGVGGAFANVGIWSGSYSIVTGDTLQYTIWVSSTSPQIMSAVDGLCTDGTLFGTYNSHALKDQNGLLAWTSQPLDGYANDQWYTRTIDLSALNGKTLSILYLAFNGSNHGQCNSYFHDISIVNGGTTKVPTISLSNQIGYNSVAPTNIWSQGYSNLTVSAVNAYEPSGTRTSPATSLTSVGVIGSSLINWQATIPTSTLQNASSSVTIYTSTDNATWQQQTSNSAITSLIIGAGASGISLYFQEVFQITGPDPTISPILTTVTATVQPTYANTNTDFIKTVSTQAGWQGGALTNVTAQSNGTLTLGSANSRNWDTGSVANQTVFGSGTASQFTSNRNLGISSNTGNDARARFDFAGTFSKLDMSISVQVPSSGNNANAGLEWGTTNYVNGVGNNTYGYVAYISATQIVLAKGNNGSAGSQTNLGTPVTFATALNAGDWHTLRVQWGQSGTGTMAVYLDGVQYITASDLTYTSAAYVGVRLYNNTGSTISGYFDNFAIVQQLTSTQYTSQNLTGFGSVGTVQDSRLFWQATVPNGASVAAQVSINGGTYTAATNGSPLPGLTTGYATIGQSINVRFILSSTDPTLQPIVSGYTAWVTSAYNSSGNRISSALSLTPVGNVGSTSINWIGVQPPNTNIYVDTSIDGTNWTQVGTGASGSAQIASLFTPTDPVVDEFVENTSANYTSTCRTGGAISTWTWDTAHNRLTASGGTNGQLLYNAPLIGPDVDLSWVMDTSDNGGAVWRWLDQGDFYSLAVHDASSLNNPNAVELFVVTGGGGGTITPYTAYYNITTSSTVGTMKQLSETLGTGTFTSKQSTIGTALGFGELFSFGTTNAWAAGASLLAPSTNNAGFIDDGILLEGNSFIAGTWIPSVRLQLNATATITADIWLRVSIRSSGGAYTSIGDCVMSGQTITGNLTTYVFPGTTFLASPTFNTGDKLSFSVQLNVLTNANANSLLACKIGMSNTVSTGLTTSQVVSPGYQAGSGGATTLIDTAPISFNRGDPHIFRVIAQNEAITVIMDGNDIITTGDSTINQAGFAGFRNDNSGGASSANFYLLRLQYYGQDVSTTNVLSRFRLTSTDPTATPQVNQYAMSVRDPNIQNGALIPLTSYSVLNGNKMTVAAILDDLIKQSGNFWWKIVNNTLIFQAHQATLAPWALTANDTLVQNASINAINDHYRNSQWGTGGTDVIALPPESFIGNGTTTTFDLGFPVDSITSITLNTATQTFALKSQSSTGYNWYYSQGQNSIVQDTSAIPLNSSQTLVVTYNAQVKITVNVINPSEVNRILSIDETTGIVDEGEDMSGQNKQAIITNCAGLNTTWGQKNTNAVINTLRPGLAVGQLLPIFLSQMGVFDGGFLIAEIKTTWNSTNQNGVSVLQPWYEIHSSSGVVVNLWERFISNLANG